MKGDLKSIDVKNKKVLIRVDFNVPLSKDFKVTDDTRIRGALPTIQYLVSQGAKVIVMSHLGRPMKKLLPDGSVDRDQFSLGPIVSVFSDLVGRPVSFANDTIGEEVQDKINAMQSGDILLLENTRFYPGEEKGDASLAGKMAALADVYVNDAFGTAHRSHASTTTIAQFFPNSKCFGSLLFKEIEAIEKVFRTGEKPVLAVLGGAKVSSKITIIENILDKVNHLIIGGGMTFTFIKAQGGHIGDSICEDDKMTLALKILEKAKSKNVKIHLPIDVLAANAFDNDAETMVVDVFSIPNNWQGLDAGPKTIKIFDSVVNECKTILWNGPLGVFEMPNFAKGTIALGNSIANATKNGAFSLVGGGDSVAAVKQFGFEDKVSYVSTGGGAMLESLEGKTLPGIAAILE